MSDVLTFHITDACAMRPYRQYRQITDVERQANHDQEREIYERSCEEWRGDGQDHC